jgi:metal-responsive CopG/Arc/MetJ family transcriptional regulator
MTNVKTAISLDKSLAERVDALAEELRVSRSHLFVLAVQEFIQRYDNHKLLESLNVAYGDSSDVEERTWRKRMRDQHRRMVQGQW